MVILIIITITMNTMKNRHILLAKLGTLLRRLMTGGTLLVLILGLLGQLVRDRTLLFTFLFYLPLIPIGIWAIVWDIGHKGRSLPIPFSLSLLGLVAINWMTISMIGKEMPSGHHSAQTSLRLLQWNVRWGGKSYRKYWSDSDQRRAWPTLRKAIIKNKADIIVLNEPPQDKRLDRLVTQLGEGWQLIRHHKTTGLEDDPRKRNTMAILSRFPLQRHSLLDFHRGQGILATITYKSRPIHLLAIDGDRNLRESKISFLTDVKKAVGKFMPDIVAGDFNAPSRSIGFDGFEQLGNGYHLASRLSAVWRGSWIGFLPLYDIDHIWFSQRLKHKHTNFLFSWVTDHRGQYIDFSVPTLGTVYNEAKLITH